MVRGLGYVLPVLVTYKVSPMMGFDGTSEGIGGDSFGGDKMDGVRSAGGGSDESRGGVDGVMEVDCGRRWCWHRWR